jgi:hypothetical protein
MLSSLFSFFVFYLYSSSLPSRSLLPTSSSPVLRFLLFLLLLQSLVFLFSFLFSFIHLFPLLLFFFCIPSPPTLLSPVVFFSFPHPSLSPPRPFHLILFSLLSLFWKIEIGMWDHLAVSVSPPQILNASTNLYETWYVYHGTWAHLSGVLHKSLPSDCVYMGFPAFVAR